KISSVHHCQPPTSPRPSRDNEQQNDAERAGLPRERLEIAGVRDEKDAPTGDDGRGPERMARAAPSFSRRTAACGPRAELGKQRRDQRGSDPHREDPLERADRSGIVRVVRIDEQNGEPAGGDQEEKEREAAPFESPTHPPIIEGAPMKKPTPG